MRLTGLSLALSVLTFGAATAAQDTPTQDTPARRPATRDRAPVAPPAAEDAPKETETAPIEDEAADEVAADPTEEPSEQEVAPAVVDDPAADTADDSSKTKQTHATTPTVPSRAFEGCTAKQVRASAALGDALVYVEAPGARGLGFVFHESRYVVTPASLVDTGRGIRVRTDVHSQAVSATVVAIDEANDLALLELASATHAVPLRAARGPTETGDTVLSLSRSTDSISPRQRRKNRKYLRARRGFRQGRTDTVVKPGRVTFASAGRFRTDALRGAHEHWGAPLLDCDGRVVGVSTSPISDESVGVAAVRSMAAEAGDHAAYWGRWSIFHPHAALVGQVDHKKTAGFGKRDKWLGFSVGTALIGHDRIYAPARFTATFLVAPDLDEPFAKRRGYRLQGSAGLGYRIMLRGGSVPFYLVPVLGGTVMYDRITTERTEFRVDAPCPEGGCLATPRVHTEEVSQLRVMPTFGAGVQWGAGELSYQFVLDTENSERSVHQLTLGVQF